MTALRRACDIDAEIMRVREQYLAADRRSDIPTLMDLYGQLDALLDERLRIPQQRTGD